MAKYTGAHVLTRDQKAKIDKVYHRFEIITTHPSVDDNTWIINWWKHGGKSGVDYFRVRHDLNMGQNIDNVVTKYTRRHQDER